MCNSAESLVSSSSSSLCSIQSHGISRVIMTIFPPTSHTAHNIIPLSLFILHTHTLFYFIKFFSVLHKGIPVQDWLDLTGLPFCFGIILYVCVCIIWLVSIYACSIRKFRTPWQKECSASVFNSKATKTCGSSMHVPTQRAISPGFASCVYYT